MHEHTTHAQSILCFDIIYLQVCSFYYVASLLYINYIAKLRILLRINKFLYIKMKSHTLKYQYFIYFSISYRLLHLSIYTAVVGGHQSYLFLWRWQYVFFTIDHLIMPHINFNSPRCSLKYQVKISDSLIIHCLQNIRLIYSNFRYRQK